MSNHLAVFFFLLLHTCLFDAPNKSETLALSFSPKFEDSIALADGPCDTVKFKDFKNNLTLLKPGKVNSKILDELDGRARKYEDWLCEHDTHYCHIDLKTDYKYAYQYKKEWKLYLFGYTANWDRLDMDTGFASLFVMAIYRDGTLWFADLFDEIDGEIKVELNGLEEKGNSVIIWGQSDSEYAIRYGKFELTIKNGEGEYYYECYGGPEDIELDDDK